MHNRCQGISRWPGLINHTNHAIIRIIIKKSKYKSSFQILIKLYLAALITNHSSLYNVSQFILYF